MTDWQLQKPVAFFVFNRPDTTERVFEEIRKARPPKLLVVADGPRPNKPGEAEKCEAVREIIEKVDWPCEVQKNYSDVNMGCKLRMSSGLDWVFENAEDAIILEDDCLPHPSFFRYCEELLEKYRYNENVMMISGCNRLKESNADTSGYFFSKYPHIWGWASWRRVWKLYDVEMKLWPELRDSGRYNDFCASKEELYFWKRYFDSVYNGSVDTWDAQVMFMSFCHKGLSIFPNVNLISNIGFGLNATHTTVASSPLANMNVEAIALPLRHPDEVVRDIIKDEIRRKIEYTSSGLFQKIVMKIASFTRKAYQ